MKQTFQGYRRENGRVGVRNHVIILPVDDLSNAACEAVAQLCKLDICARDDRRAAKIGRTVYLIRTGAPLVEQFSIQRHILVRMSYHPANSAIAKLDYVLARPRVERAKRTVDRKAVQRIETHAGARSGATKNMPTDARIASDAPNRNAV